MARTMDIDEAIAENERLIDVAPTMSEANRLRRCRDVLDIIKMSLERNHGSSYVTIDDEGNPITYTMKKETTMERRVFTYKDVEEARKYIGMPGVFSENLFLLEKAQEGEPVGVLWHVGTDGFPFQSTGMGYYQFFSPDPEPVEKWVPFTEDDWQEILGARFRNKGDNPFPVFIAHGVAKDGVAFGPNRIASFSEFFDQYEKVDGSPCGKKVVE